MFELTIRGTEQKVALRDIPALRQTFVVASVAIIVGVALSITTHPYFLALPLVISGGLMFAGLVGWCPMATLMGKLPWNK
jgi:hypothetical protein